MHIVESYATSCGVKIDRPYVYEKFFPMVTNRYVTIDCDARASSKLYHYWQEVADLLLPVLKDAGLALVQVGRKDDPPVVGCYDTRGQTSYNQTAYIISKSKLHLGVDNFSADLAGYYNVKNVCIFSNSLPEQSKPYWSASNIYIESPKDGNKPSYSHFENPKTINQIKPNEIVEAVFKLLNLESNFNFNYKYIGVDYHTPRANLIPDSLIHDYSLPQMIVSARMDYLFNEEALASNLKAAKLNIVTDKPIDPNIIIQFRQSLGKMTYIVDENHEVNFVKFLLSQGVDYDLISYLPVDEIQRLKLKYMDYGIITAQKKLTKKDVLGDYDGPLFYKSNKYILSRGKIYPSKSAWTRDLTSEERGLQKLSFSTQHSRRPGSLEKKVSPIIDENDFWDDVGSFCILSAK